MGAGSRAPGEGAHLLEALLPLVAHAAEAVGARLAVARRAALQMPHLPQQLVDLPPLAPPLRLRLLLLAAAVGLELVLEAVLPLLRARTAHSPLGLGSCSCLSAHTHTWIACVCHGSGGGAARPAEW